MKKLNALYLLLIASMLTLQVACDDSGEVPNGDAGEAMAGEAMAGEAMAGEAMAGETMAGESMAGVNIGGESMAGEAVAGEAVAGEAMAGEAVAGEAMAGEAVEERVGPGDTDALSCSGDYCPSARLSAFSLPMDAASATAGGCRLTSERNGTALGGLLMLVGGVDTNELVRPNPETGEIQLVLLNQLVGWESGSTGNEAGTLKADFFTGVQENETEFMIDPVSLVDGEPIIFFDGTTIVDGLYQTQPSDFIVDLPIADLPLQLRLSQAEVSGFVTVDEVGFNMTEGVLGGYLTKDAIVELIEGINTVCAADEPPSLCDSVGSFLSGNAEQDLGLLLPILGGFDAAVAADGSTSACSGDSPDCNAISVCVLLEMSSATITGVADAQ